MEDGYKFNSQFQEKILALLVRDHSFLLCYREVVKPYFFENPVHVDIARIITNYYDRYQGIATFETTLTLIDDYLEQRGKRSKDPEDLRRLYYKTLDNIYGMDFTDTEYVKDRAVQFAKHQAIKDAILKSVDLLGEDKFEEILEVVHKAQQVGENADNLGLIYFENIAERLNSSQIELAEGILGTGSRDLDDAIGGGLGSKELGFIIAPPNVGKTLRLINIGTAGLWQRKTVIHYTLEMSETRVASRYDACLSGRPISELSEVPGKLEEQLKKIEKQSGGKLVIKEFPTGTASINDIKSHLTMLKNIKGLTPGLVIVDYADLMRPTSTYNEKRHELSNINVGIRSLAKEMKIPLWTASQTNRGSLDKKIITIADFAEDFSKAAVADIVVALCQTQEEYDEGLLREFVAKSRNSKKFQVLNKKVDYDKMKVMDDGVIGE